MHRGPARRWLVLPTMCVGMFLVLLDVTIVNVALADIRRDLAVHAAGLEWVVDADTLGFATLMLTGRAAPRWCPGRPVRLAVGVPRERSGRRGRRGSDAVARPRRPATRATRPRRARSGA